MRYRFFNNISLFITEFFKHAPPFNIDNLQQLEPEELLDYFIGFVNKVNNYDC